MTPFVLPTVSVDTGIVPSGASRALCKRTLTNNKRDYVVDDTFAVRLPTSALAAVTHENYIESMLTMRNGPQRSRVREILRLLRLVAG